MNSTRWLHHFHHNQTLHRQPEAEPCGDVRCPLDDATRRALARSLAHFQLGESGEGRHLLAWAARDPEAAADPGYREALRLFLEEEHAHARLLARVVGHLGGTLVRRHWSHRAFKALRRLLGLRFEIQVLVTAELIGLTYYRLLGQRVRDPVVEAACARFVRDERGHLSFHRDWLGGIQHGWLPAGKALWAWAFQAIFLAVEFAVWLDHGGALRSVGVRRELFTREARRECGRWLGALAAGEPAGSTFRVGEENALAWGPVTR